MEDIFQNTLVLWCLTSSKVDMVDFVNFNKAVIRRNAFSGFFKNNDKEREEKKFNLILSHFDHTF